MIGTIDQVIADMQNGVFDFTKDGECSQCGSCCSNMLPMSVKEAVRIQNYIERHHIKECLHRPPTVNPVQDWTCPFRDNDKKICTIYEVRPAICRDFRCDKPRNRIEADKRMYHGKYGILDVRGTFFPKEKEHEDRQQE